jgi:hypothetical protein
MPYGDGFASALQGIREDSCRGAREIAKRPVEEEQEPVFVDGLQTAAIGATEFDWRISKAPGPNFKIELNHRGARSRTRTCNLGIKSPLL